MSWLKAARKGIDKIRQGADKKAGSRLEVPENLWTKCDRCGDLIYHKELATNLWVCYQCGHHFPIAAHRYFDLLLDEGTVAETHKGLVSVDPLEFKDSKRYRDRLKEYRARTGREDAALTATGNLEGIPVSMAVMDFSFMGGSMGSVVGEKIARAIKDGINHSCPVIVVSRSGGARMQESVLSLMQLAKTSAMLARLAREQLPYVSVITHPTTGGVTASFAMLGDVNLAEPQALIGFAGPRVIKQTINKELPEGFQRSEFLLEHGMIDRIVERSRLKPTIHEILSFLMPAAAPEGAEESDAAPVAPVPHS